MSPYTSLEYFTISNKLYNRPLIFEYRPSTTLPLGSEHNTEGGILFEIDDGSP